MPSSDSSSDSLGPAAGTRHPPTDPAVDHEPVQGEAYSSDDQDAVAAKIRNHKLWQQRVSSATPQARTHKQVVSALAHSFGNPSAKQTRSSRPVKDDSNQHTKALETQYRPDAGRSKQAKPLPSASDLQRLRHHRLWRSRESDASPERRAQRRVGGAMQAWQAGSSTRNTEAYRAPDPAFDKVVPFEPHQGTPHPATHEPHAHHHAPAQPATDLRRLRTHRLWRSRESDASPERRAQHRVTSALQAWHAGAGSPGQPPASAHDDVLPVDMTTHSHSSYEDEQADQAVHKHHEHHTDLQRLQRHRLWQSRDSDASPERRAQRRIGHAMHAWQADGAGHSIGQGSTVWTGWVADEPLTHDSPAAGLVHGLHAASGSAWETKSSRQAPGSRQPHGGGQTRAQHHNNHTAHAAQGEQWLGLEALGDEGQGHIPATIAKLREHKLWHARTSSASPDARAARSVRHALSDWAVRPPAQPDDDPPSTGHIRQSTLHTQPASSQTDGQAHYDELTPGPSAAEQQRTQFRARLDQRQQRKQHTQQATASAEAVAAPVAPAPLMRPQPPRLHQARDTRDAGADREMTGRYLAPTSTAAAAAAAHVKLRLAPGQHVQPGASYTVVQGPDGQLLLSPVQTAASPGALHVPRSAGRAARAQAPWAETRTSHWSGGSTVHVAKSAGYGTAPRDAASWSDADSEPQVAQSVRPAQRHTQHATATASPSRDRLDDTLGNYPQLHHSSYTYRAGVRQRSPVRSSVDLAPSHFESSRNHDIQMQPRDVRSSITHNPIRAEHQHSGLATPASNPSHPVTSVQHASVLTEPRWVSDLHSALPDTSDRSDLDYLPIVSITDQLQTVITRLKQLTTPGSGSSSRPPAAPRFSPRSAELSRVGSPSAQRPSATLCHVLSQAASPRRHPASNATSPRHASLTAHPFTTHTPTATNIKQPLGISSPRNSASPELHAAHSTARGVNSQRAHTTVNISPPRPSSSPSHTTASSPPRLLSFPPHHTAHLGAPHQISLSSLPRVQIHYALQGQPDLPGSVDAHDSPSSASQGSYVRVTSKVNKTLDATLSRLRQLLADAETDTNAGLTRDQWRSQAVEPGAFPGTDQHQWDAVSDAEHAVVDQDPSPRHMTSDRDTAFMGSPAREDQGPAAGLLAGLDHPQAKVLSIPFGDGQVSVTVPAPRSSPSPLLHGSGAEGVAIIHSTPPHSAATTPVKAQPAAPDPVSTHSGMHSPQSAGSIPPASAPKAPQAPVDSSPPVMPGPSVQGGQQHLGHHHFSSSPINTSLHHQQPSTSTHQPDSSSARRARSITPSSAHTPRTLLLTPPAFAATGPSPPSHHRSIAKLTLSDVLPPPPPGSTSSAGRRRSHMQRSFAAVQHNSTNHSPALLSPASTSTPTPTATTRPSPPWLLAEQQQETRETRETRDGDDELHLCHVIDPIPLDTTRLSLHVPDWSNDSPHTASLTPRPSAATAAATATTSTTSLDRPLSAIASMPGLGASAAPTVLHGSSSTTAALSASLQPARSDRLAAQDSSRQSTNMTGVVQAVNRQAYSGAHQTVLSSASQAVQAGGRPTASAARSHVNTVPSTSSVHKSRARASDITAMLARPLMVPSRHLRLTPHASAAAAASSLTSSTPMAPAQQHSRDVHTQHTGGGIHSHTTLSISPVVSRHQTFPVAPGAGAQVQVQLNSRQRALAEGSNARTSHADQHATQATRQSAHPPAPGGGSGLVSPLKLTSLLQPPDKVWPVSTTARRRPAAAAQPALRAWHQPSPAPKHVVLLAQAQHAQHAQHARHSSQAGSDLSGSLAAGQQVSLEAGESAGIGTPAAQVTRQGPPDYQQHTLSSLDEHPGIPSPERQHQHDALIEPIALSLDEPDQLPDQGAMRAALQQVDQRTSSSTSSSHTDLDARSDDDVQAGGQVAHHETADDGDEPPGVFEGCMDTPPPQLVQDWHAPVQSLIRPGHTTTTTTESTPQQVPGQSVKQRQPWTRGVSLSGSVTTVDRPASGSNSQWMMAHVGGARGHVGSAADNMCRLADAATGLAGAAAALVGAATDLAASLEGTAVQVSAVCAESQEQAEAECELQASSATLSVQRPDQSCGSLMLWGGAVQAGPAPAARVCQSGAAAEVPPVLPDAHQHDIGRELSERPSSAAVPAVEAASHAEHTVDVPQEGEEASVTTHPSLPQLQQPCSLQSDSWCHPSTEQLSLSSGVSQQSYGHRHTASRSASVSSPTSVTSAHQLATAAAAAAGQSLTRSIIITQPDPKSVTTSASSDSSAPEPARQADSSSRSGARSSTGSRAVTAHAPNPTSELLADQLASPAAVSGTSGASVNQIAGTGPMEQQAGPHHQVQVWDDPASAASLPSHTFHSRPAAEEGGAVDSLPPLVAPLEMFAQTSSVLGRYAGVEDTPVRLPAGEVSAGQLSGASSETPGQLELQEEARGSSQQLQQWAVSTPHSVSLIAAASIQRRSGGSVQQQQQQAAAPPPPPSLPVQVLAAATVERQAAASLLQQAGAEEQVDVRQAGAQGVKNLMALLFCSDDDEEEEEEGEEAQVPVGSAIQEQGYYPAHMQHSGSLVAHTDPSRTEQDTAPPQDQPAPVQAQDQRQEVAAHEQERMQRPAVRASLGQLTASLMAPAGQLNLTGLTGSASFHSPAPASPWPRAASATTFGSTSSTLHQPVPHSGAHDTSGVSRVDVRQAAARWSTSEMLTRLSAMNRSTQTLAGHLLAGPASAQLQQDMR